VVKSWKGLDKNQTKRQLQVLKDQLQDDALLAAPLQRLTQVIEGEQAGSSVAEMATAFFETD
jgi:hypothetical protein